MIDWVSVKERVPNNRRTVLVWGISGIAISGGYSPGQGKLLGTTRFNPSPDGGMFDIERGFLMTYIVTHWADIEGPTT